MSDPITLFKEASNMNRMVENCFRKKKFDNKFLLSLATLSLEKYMVAYLLMKDEMPTGHTLTHLIQRVAEYEKVSLSDVSLLEQLDEKIQLCSVSIAPEYVPENDEMEMIIDVMEHIRKIVDQELSALLLKS